MTRRLKGYDLAEQIGIGGFGAVYRAAQPELAREVAIKVILPEYADQPEFIRRFEVEAQMIARLEHLHIVPLYDYWRDPDGAYLVMRYMRGGSLRGVIAGSASVSAGRAGRLIGQIAAALAAAHARDIIHRDIKPENILLDEYGNAYLADFNIARSRHSAGVVERFGTASYAAPEQLRDDAATPQTDLYSLGIILYELLTGALPIGDPLPPVQKQRPDLPYALNDVLWRVLARDPDSRYPDALAFAADVRRVLGDEPAVPPIPAQHISLPATEEHITRVIVPVVETRNPYRGLHAFEAADADVFFGREAFADRLIRRLSADRFAVVIGASGSGKSSAVLAGTLPRLRVGALPASDRWFYALMKPGSSPFDGLAVALRGVNTEAITREALERGAWRAGLPADSTLLLVIDQFEEVFTGGDANAFLGALIAALRDDCLYVIATLRADFYDRPLADPEFAPLLRDHTEVIVPLTLAELTRAVEKPAERENVKFEPGLVARILEDVRDQPGALPLLQYALTELFAARDGRTITRRAYEASGGISGAVGRRADTLYTALDDAGRTAAREIFLRLVDPFTLTRRRIPLSEIAHIDGRGAVLERYAASRLLTLDHDPGTHAPTVEVAHEALIAAWDRLRGWIDAARDDLRLRTGLRAAAAEWEKARRDRSYLATGSRLVAFEPLLNASALALSGSERDYLAASIEARAAARRRARFGVIGLALVAGIAVLLALSAFDGQRRAVEEQQRAESEARVSRSRELAAASLSAADQIDLALLLSVEALNTADTYEARNALLTGLTAHLPLAGFVHLAGDATPFGEVRALITCGGGIAASGRGGRIALWETPLDDSEPRLVGTPDGAINALACSPDGARIAAAGADGVIRVWTLSPLTPDPTPAESAGITAPFSGVDPSAAGELRALAWHGEMIAAGGDDGVIRLWDTASGDLIRELNGHTGAVWSIAFAPDGSRLYSGGADNTIRVWAAHTGRVIDTWDGHTNWVLTLALSPDGTRLASGSADTTIRLWDAQTGSSLGALRGHTNWVRALAFSADGTWLASGGADHTVRLWDMATGDSDALAGHRGAVWGVAFAEARVFSGGGDPFLLTWTIPGTDYAAAFDGAIQSFAFSSGENKIVAAVGNRLMLSGSPAHVIGQHDGLITSIRRSRSQFASASEDGVIKLWDARSFTQIGELRPGVNVIQQIAYSPDGSRIAAVGGGGTAVLEIASGAVIARYAPAALSAVFSPDGGMLLIGERGGRIAVYRDGSSDPVTWEGHTDGVMSLTFSPDDARVISTGRDGAILVWDFASGTLLHRLEGHTDWVASAAYSLDGRILASADHQGVIRLWDTERWLPLGNPFQMGDGWINHVEFDGAALLAGGQAGQVYRLDTRTREVRAHACRAAGRDLSADEWTLYFGEAPYAPLTCLLSKSS
jgi:WD40 repeat protein